MSGSVAVVIVNYRTPDLALEAARSVAGERGALPGLRVIIVDGGSGDGSAEQLIAGVADSALSSWVRVLPLALNGGFGWANNQAMLGLIQGDDPPDYIHLLNPDAVVLPGAIAALAAMLDQDPQCAAAGSALFNTDGSAAGSQFRFMSPPREFARGLRTDAIRRALGIKPLMIEGNGEVDDVDWVTGASLMLRVTALREVGLFDTGFFLYFEEVELCWRLKQSGWQVRHAPLSRVRHVGGAATRTSKRAAASAAGANAGSGRDDRRVVVLVCGPLGISRALRGGARRSATPQSTRGARPLAIRHRPQRPGPRAASHPLARAARRATGLDGAVITVGELATKPDARC
jgi:GT2 family glycosyltransferase